jgi:hypothetical protein
MFAARNLDLRRFDNLMIHWKSVALPCGDPVSFGVNAELGILRHTESFCFRGQEKNQACG